MKNHIQLLRPKHCIKNVLVFLPLVFSGRLLERNLLKATAFAFFAFCALASIVYIINDIRDMDRDRQHPTKKNRPIASGAIPVSVAIADASLLFLLVIVAGILGHFSLISWLYLVLYFLLNLGYSLGMKNIPIADIAILVSGFLLRVLFGSAVSGIETSGWLYLTVTSVSFYMSLGKRRGELQQSGETTRKVLRYYSSAFLTQNMQMFLTLAIVFYSLWSKEKNSALLFTVPLVICICLRYSMTVEGNSDGDPVEVIYQDKPLVVMTMIFSIMTLALIYV